MVDVLSPRQWGAIVDYDEWNDPFTPDDGVALHHGGGENYEAHRPPYSRSKEIQQLQQWEGYHIYSKGWRGLAYGWGVGQTGTLYRIRGWNTYGAHTGDRDGDGIANNTEIVPILFIGSGSRVSLSPEAQSAIEWLRRNVIEVKSPNAKTLYGHQELKGTVTSCPGSLAMEYVKTHRLLERKEEDMTELQARLEVATGVYERTGQWMTGGTGETPQQRLTRLAREVVNGRLVADVLQFFGTPKAQAPAIVPAWVLSRFVAEGTGAVEPGVSRTEFDAHRHAEGVTGPPR